jgi:hypothetical protein
MAMLPQTILLSLFSISRAFSFSSSFDELSYRTAPFRVITPNGTLPQRKSPCVVEYSTSNYPDHLFYHVHIPKTGGQTIYGCMLRSWGREGGFIQGNGSPNCRNVSRDVLSSIHYLSCEITYNGEFSSIMSSLKRTNREIMAFTMIRQPLSYVFSALEHHITRRGHAACQDFNAIIVADRKNFSACAHYDIRNLQTRVFSSSDPKSFDPTTFGPANLTQALSILRNELFSIGITGYFRASLCLLAYQMGQLHLHKPVCDCRQLDPTIKIFQKNKSSNSTLNRHNLLSAEALEVLLSQYINLDEILYNYALDLFLSRIIVAERHENIKLLCAHTDDEAIMLRIQLMKKELDHGR